jgi:dCMP deaminase
MRISRELMYMEIANVFSRRSTCFRNNVGAVIVCTEGWVINGTGYNGPPPGEEHCAGNDCDLTSHGGCRRSVHAERNALDRMHNWLINGTQWLFTTRSPCYECAVAILNSGAIGRVYYDEPYRDQSPIKLLVEGGISCFRVLPSGYVLDPALNLIVANE